MIVRSAELTDASSIAKVNIETWKSTYKGIIEDEYLDSLSYEQREQAIKSLIINSSLNKKYVFVAEDNTNGVIGFASCGIERENDEIFKGELYSIYILKEFQNKGIGKLLYNSVIQKLQENNLIPMIIWILKENRQARNFYELMGGKKIKERYINIDSQEIKEVAYGCMS